MDYLVLARKWRPQVFEDVVGQDHVVKTLKNAVRLNRIAHAYLFSGPRGIGKTSVARILSKALNCEKGPTETPCNQCVQCREITEGISMDVREIDGASNRGIDEIRELRENVRFSPASSRYKVYIIDEVHMLTAPAFNALLKTIEEPPAHVIFIFATTESHKIPATILSRCQRHDFRRVSPLQTREHLKRIAEAEGVRISETGLDRIAEASEGSMRDSQSIFDQVISYAGNEISDGDIEELLGFSDRRLLYDLSGAILNRDGKTCLKIIDEAYFAGLDMKFFYQKVINHFLNLLVAKIAGQEPGGGYVPPANLADDEPFGAKEQLKGVSRETLQRLLEILMAEEEEVRRSPDPKFNLEFVLIKMTYLDPLIPLDEMLSRMEGLEKRLSESGGEESPEESCPEEKKGAPAEILPQPAGEWAEEGTNQAWAAFRAFVKRKTPPLWSNIDKGAFLGYENGILRIGFPKNSVLLDIVNEVSRKERLAELAGEFFGAGTSIGIESIESEGEQNELAVRNGIGKNKNDYQMKRVALSHPLVQKVMDLFEGAEIKDVIKKG